MSAPWLNERTQVLGERAVALGKRLSTLASSVCPRAAKGLDIGGGDGTITRMLARTLHLDLTLIDPDEPPSDRAPSGITFTRGTAVALPFRDSSFDIVFLNSVYEHIQHPQERLRCLREIRRVLTEGGVLVGQMPNMNFPVEIHSKLPLIQFLPRWLARPYFNLCSPEPEERKKRFGIRWYRVTRGDLSREAAQAGFTEGRIWGMNPPREAIPSMFRWGLPFTRFIPMNWDFYFRKVRAPGSPDL